MRSLRRSSFPAFALLLLLPAGVRADAVLDWNEIALDRVAAAKQLPPEAARAMAIVHVAMFDAVNAVERRYRPFAYRQSAPEGSAPAAAIASAAHAALAGLFPQDAAALDARFADSLAGLRDDRARADGVAVGRAAAAACLGARTEDGAGAGESYRPHAQPGVYVPTTIPVSSTWPRVAPWFVHLAELRPPPPPALESEIWARDYDEVRRLGAKASAERTAEQTDVARFWTITGPASWNPVVRALVERRELPPIESARLFALVSVAAADALLAVFDAKYAYNFWRPITAIRNGDVDGNEATELDPRWLPLLETPLHPEYPCAHCITSAAVGEVLALELGRGAIGPIEMSSPAAPGVVRRWNRIEEYVTEVSLARIWGGVHYRHSTEVGREMGRTIGALAVRRLALPRSSGEAQPAELLR